MPRLTRLLGFRLFFLILLIGFAVSFTLTAFSIQANKKQLIDQIVKNANYANDLIQGSVHYGMLVNHKEEVARTIISLGKQPGVESIRIYNKKGIIAYSTDEREIGHVVDMKAEQCTVCHSPEKTLFFPNFSKPRIFDSPKGYRVVAVTKPIMNEPACSKPTCHPPPSEQKILGVLDSKISLVEMDKILDKNRNQLAGYSLVAIVLIELFTAMFIWFMVHDPVRKLTEGIRHVTDGNLDFQLDVRGGDEISSLARAFNKMVSDLKKSEAENREWANTLEYKVEQKTKELKQAHEQMIHVAKMASMGKLAATVAHEINNPLGGILTYTKLLKKNLESAPPTEAQRSTMVNQLDTVVNEIKRCGNLVRNMLHFAKSPTYDVNETDMHSIIEKSLFIVNHHLEINNIKIVNKLEAKNPKILANAGQMQQALIAIFINAVEAMKQSGTLSIATKDSPDGTALELRVSDTGKGIPKENLEYIFEPFYTTKEETSGVGLGLSVVYGIVKSHQGEIRVESEVGVGTTFIIVLPREWKAKPEDEQSGMEKNI